MTRLRKCRTGYSATEQFPDVHNDAAYCLHLRSIDREKIDSHGWDLAAKDRPSCLRFATIGGDCVGLLERDYGSARILFAEHLRQFGTVRSYASP